MAKKKRKDTGTEPAEEPTNFEEALGQLEATVAKLEQGNVGLADALSCYEQGVKYLRYCHGVLQQAERKIEQLTGLDAEGNPVTQPFVHEASAAEGPPAASKRVNKRSTKRAKPPVAEDAVSDDVDEPRRLF